MKTLKDLFLEELSDMYDAENRLVKALPKLAKAATCDKLKSAILAHLKQTEGHVIKLEQVFASCDQKAKGQTCEATVALIKEGEKLAENFKDSPAINAALISAAQKVEHHEIASYGCLHEWAKLLENTKAAGYLEEILNEEKAANETLIELARASSNREALGESSEDEPEQSSAKKPVTLNRVIPTVSTTSIKRPTSLTR
jgi:ferritin-like metal-binding protein YciE